MLQLTDDQDWNKELIPGGTPKGFKQIDERLLKLQLVAYSSRNTYIYLIASKSWSVFVSAEAQIQLCSIVGSDNASVNYLSASIPYVNYLQKNAVRVRSIPTSICLGTRRLSIYLDEKDDIIYLKPQPDIVPITEGIDERVGDFCVMPCMYEKYPTKWNINGEQRILKFLNVLFPDPIELGTICWVIGNAIVDPSSVSKFLLLYGPGGTGKSTLISIIEDVLKGCCGTIKSSTLTDIRQDVTLDTAKAVASNRVLTAGDIDLEVNKMNLHIVKELTGHDSIAVPPLKVATHCSVIAACNNLPHVSKQTSWASPAISRRMIVSVMNVKSSLLPKRFAPDSIEDNLDFLMYSVYTYLTSETVPVSTRCLLYTLLGNGYNEIRDKLEITDKATEQEIFDANTNIEIYFKLELHTLGELAMLVSPSSVIQISSISFVKNIKLKEDLE